VPGADPMPSIALHGLGAMGWPMAQRLVQHGLALTAFDADPAVQQRWQQQTQQHSQQHPQPHSQQHSQPHLKPVHGPGAVEADAKAAHAEVVLVCVTDEAASRRVWQQQLSNWRPGSLVIELGSTSHAWALQAAARCADAGVRYADAPLSGGVGGAQAGSLVAMLGALESDVALVQAVLAPCTARVLHVGPPGAGQLCKMANQLAIAGVAAGLVQAQAFSRAVGLDLGQVMDVLASGSAASVQLERLRHVLAAEGNDAAQTFAWLHKDLLLCQQASAQALPLAALWQAWWQAPASLRDAVDPP
jgi:3-hydroxyisobutyrate dehydrogenase